MELQMEGKNTPRIGTGERKITMELQMEEKINREEKPCNYSRRKINLKI